MADDAKFHACFEGQIEMGEELFAAERQRRVMQFENDIASFGRRREDEIDVLIPFESFLIVGRFETLDTGLLLRAACAGGAADPFDFTTDERKSFGFIDFRFVFAFRLLDEKVRIIPFIGIKQTMEKFDDFRGGVVKKRAVMRDVKDGPIGF